MVIGDHGWKLGHLGGWGKHSLMTQDTHVPLIIRTPRHGPSGSGGRVVHEPVELIDLYPTLLITDQNVSKGENNEIRRIIGGKAVRAELESILEEINKERKA